MDDHDIMQHIGEMADEERRLEEAHVGEGLSAGEQARLKKLEASLDQMWDLLRQRRALRESGKSPDLATPRSTDTVEHFLQ